MDTTADCYMYAGVRMMEEFTKILVSSVIAAAAGLLGVYVGSRMSLARDRAERRHRFLRAQLEEFYAPLFGVRQEIRAKSVFRQKVRSATPALDPLSERDTKAFERMIEYDNKALEEDLIPGYRQMVTIFKEKIGFAEESTVAEYYPLLEFVETWTRSQKGGLPGTVLQQIGHEEERVYPLYDDIEHQVKRLRSELRAGGTS